MAPGSADRRLQFSGRRGEGLTLKQLELMAKGSLLDRFKKPVPRLSDTFVPQGKDLTRKPTKSWIFINPSYLI
jgi:hypothetical protein